MLYLQRMSNESFEKFKKESQQIYATDFASTEIIPIETALEYASAQFNKIASAGLSSEDQLFFDVKKGPLTVGYLWIGFQTRFGRKITSINDINITTEKRGQGLGKALMKLIEDEAKQAGSERIRLHVFSQNVIAQKLYSSMGYLATNIDMRKEL